MRTMPKGVAEKTGTTREHLVEVHVREVAQLFDSLDPCPFYERDLEADAEDYIVASVRELPTGVADAIVVYADQPSGQPDDQRTIEGAIHRHFARKAQFASRELRDLLRRGWISLVIGLAFLATLVVASETVVRGIEPGHFATVLRESFVIGGWVAMWRPLEFFLYDWWPIVGRRRLFTALSQIPGAVNGCNVRRSIPEMYHAQHRDQRKGFPPSRYGLGTRIMLACAASQNTPARS